MSTLACQHFVVGEVEAGWRLQRFCLERLKEQYGSRRLVAKAIKRGEVLVNGEVMEETRVLKAGDKIVCTPDWKASVTLRDSLDLDVCYENEHMAAVWKPSGLIVTGKREKTFEMALPYLLTCPRKEGWIVGSNQGEDGVATWGVAAASPLLAVMADGSLAQPIAVSPLARPACGLVLVAKTKVGYDELTRLFQEPIEDSMPTSIVTNDLLSPHDDGVCPANNNLQIPQDDTRCEQDNGHLWLRYRLICHGRMQPNETKNEVGRKCVLVNGPNTPLYPSRYTDPSTLELDQSNTSRTSKVKPKVEGGSESKEQQRGQEDSAGQCIVITRDHPTCGTVHVHPGQCSHSTCDAGWLQTVDLWVSRVRSAASLRRYMNDLGWPIVGCGVLTAATKGSPQKGLFMSLSEVRLTLPRLGLMGISICRPEPEKFAVLRAREEKFYQRKIEALQATIEAAGVKGVVDAAKCLGPDGLPLAYLLQEKVFCNLHFKVTPDVLIPRPSTETLVKAVCELATAEEEAMPFPHILDLGTGSGCILLACCHALPKSTGMGVDLSEKALVIARENARALSLEARTIFGEADFGKLHWEDESLPEGMRRSDRCFDILVCNPPYLQTNSKIDGMVTRHEPSLALYAGDRGLVAYSSIIQSLAARQPPLLRPGGYLVLEVGSGLADPVSDMVSRELGWTLHTKYRDGQDIVRCLVFCNTTTNH